MLPKSEIRSQSITLRIVLLTSFMLTPLVSCKHGMFDSKLKDGYSDVDFDPNYAHFGLGYRSFLHEFGMVPCVTQRGQSQPMMKFVSERYDQRKGELVFDTDGMPVVDGEHSGRLAAPIRFHFDFEEITSKFELMDALNLSFGAKIKANAAAMESVTNTNISLTNESSSKLAIVNNSKIQRGETWVLVKVIAKGPTEVLDWKYGPPILNPDPTFNIVQRKGDADVALMIQKLISKCGDQYLSSISYGAELYALFKSSATLKEKLKDFGYVSSNNTGVQASGPLSGAPGVNAEAGLNTQLTSNFKKTLEEVSDLMQESGEVYQIGGFSEATTENEAKKIVRGIKPVPIRFEELWPHVKDFMANSAKGSVAISTRFQSLTPLYVTGFSDKTLDNENKSPFTGEPRLRRQYEYLANLNPSVSSSAPAANAKDKKKLQVAFARCLEIKDVSRVQNEDQYVFDWRYYPGLCQSLKQKKFPDYFSSVPANEEEQLIRRIELETYFSGLSQTEALADLYPDWHPHKYVNQSFDDHAKLPDLPPLINAMSDATSRLQDIQNHLEKFGPAGELSFNRMDGQKCYSWEHFSNLKLLKEKAACARFMLRALMQSYENKMKDCYVNFQNCSVREVTNKTNLHAIRIRLDDIEHLMGGRVNCKKNIVCTYKISHKNYYKVARRVATLPLEPIWWLSGFDDRVLDAYYAKTKFTTVHENRPRSECSVERFNDWFENHQYKGWERKKAEAALCDKLDAKRQLRRKQGIPDNRVIDVRMNVSFVPFPVDEAN